MAMHGSISTRYKMPTPPPGKPRPSPKSLVGHRDSSNGLCQQVNANVRLDTVKNLSWLAGFLSDRHTEPRKDRHPGGAGKAGLLEQGSELLGGVESDPTGIGPLGDGGADGVVPGRPGIDDAVDAAWPEALVGGGRGPVRFRQVVMREAAVDEIELSRECSRQRPRIGLKEAGMV